MKSITKTSSCFVTACFWFRNLSTSLGSENFLLKIIQDIRFAQDDRTTASPTKPNEMGLLGLRGQPLKGFALQPSIKAC